jgi:16S rRNA (cytosine967-C5)-methyltransferase
VQDKGSQYIVKCLDAKEGDIVVDVCAAPGGKSTASAEAMGDRGRVIAMDVSPGRAESIVREKQRLGLASVETQVRDALTPDSSLAGAAERVLVDAPCSGVGTARRKPEVKYRLCDERTEALPALQGAILAASASYVKPGGVLVYSTCTLFRRENEDVTERFLAESEGFRLEERLRLTPEKDGTDGYYVCRMKRKG